MSKVEIELNYQGVNELRKSPELEACLTEIANNIRSRCSGDYEVSAPFKGRLHSNVEVVTADKDTYYRNLKNNELLKALR